MAQTLPVVNRARIIMDLLKDDQVTDGRLANYADTEIDYAGAALAVTYADAFCAFFGESVDGTNDEKATVFVQHLKQYCKDIRKQIIDREADEAAEDATQATLIDELGENE